MYIKHDIKGRVYEISTEESFESVFFDGDETWLDESIVTENGAYRMRYENGVLRMSTQKEIEDDVLEFTYTIPLSGEERALEDSQKALNTLKALKPIIADLLKDREADVVIRLKEFLPEWSKKGWERGQSLIRNDYPYKVVQTHDSTEQEGWEPELYQAGFAPWHGRSPDTALPYIKPRHGEENYLPGEYMMWEDGLIYLSQRSTNFSPIEYPNDWYVQKEDGSFGPINAEQPEEPEVPVDPPEEPEDPPVELNRNGTVVWSEWVDMWALYPGVWEKQFQMGDRVTHLGKRKISEIDNNTYEPIDANWSAWRDA